jgi:hypothetical protein
MKWKDNRLKWMPANYENVRQVTAFRNTPPRSRPTYTFTAFSYMNFPGHGLHIKTSTFLGPQKNSFGRVLQKTMHFHCLQKTQQGQRIKKKKHQSSHNEKIFKDKGLKILIGSRLP